FDFFFSSRRRHTRFSRDWSSDVCSSDLRTCVLLLGVLAGIYPAWSLARCSAHVRHKPAGSGFKGLRESLLLLQLVASVSVISCTDRKSVRVGKCCRSW